MHFVCYQFIEYDFLTTPRTWGGGTCGLGKGSGYGNISTLNRKHCVVTTGDSNREKNKYHSGLSGDARKSWGIVTTEEAKATVSSARCHCHTLEVEAGLASERDGQI